MQMTKYGQALTTLARYFQVTTDTFEHLDRVMVIEWADDVTEAVRSKRTISLKTWQHRFLVGEDGISRHRTQLIERLDWQSLVAVAGVGGRTIQQVMDAARVR
jgi:hypothetical protein